MSTTSLQTVPRWLRPLLLVVTLLLFALAVATEISQPLFELPQAVADAPWLWYSMVDFYAAAMVFWLWLCGKEARVASRVLWLLLIVGLGSMAITAYLWWLLRRYPAGMPLATVVAWGETSHE
jgi:hypothetical protein